MPVLGVARSTVYAKLGGKQRFTVGEVAMLAEFFEIAPAAFLAGPDALIRSSNSLDTRTVSIKNRPNAPAYPARHHPRTTRTLALCPSAA